MASWYLTIVLVASWANARAVISARQHTTTAPLQGETSYNGSQTSSWKRIGIYCSWDRRESRGQKGRNTCGAFCPQLPSLSRDSAQTV